MSKNITDLRETLFETMQALKDGKIDIEKAKAISDIGQVIINSAKVEVDFVKQAGGVGSGFIPDDKEPPKKIERPKAQYSNRTTEDILKEYSPT